MKMTQGAINNLCNRYRAVLKKCHLLNTFGSLAMAAMLVMGGAGAAAAADTTVTTANDFKTAVETATVGDTITLGQDITDGVGAVFKTGVTVDLNGHTYTAYDNSVGSSNTETNLFQLLRESGDVTLKNGTINVADQLGPDGTFKLGLQNYSNLTLENMTVDGRNLLESSPYTMSNNCGDISIKNSTIIAKEGGFAFDLYYWPKNGYVEGVSVDVENSTITGRIELTVDGSAAIGDNKHELTLTGGTLTGGLTASNGGQIDTVGTVSVADVAFTGNTATNKGGAVYNHEKNAINGEIAGKGLFTSTNVAYSDNKARDGGAIYNEGTLTVDGNTFTGNTANNAGGAIYNAAGSSITFTGDNTFSNNTAAGEANDIYNLGNITVAEGTTTLEGGLVLAGGTVDVVDNGALNGAVTWKNASASSSTTSELITVDGTGAHLNGDIATGGSAIVGNVTTDANNATTISGVDFDGNTLTASSNYPLIGTITADLAAGQSLTVTNSTFTDNSVELTGSGSSGMSGGAAISARGQGEGASLSISDSSFSGNTYNDTATAQNGAYGGAVGVQNMDVTLTNVLMTDNAGNSGNQIQGGAYYQSVGSLNATGISIADNQFEASSNVMGAGMVLWGTSGSIGGNSTFSGNTATTTNSALGGGMYIRGSRWGGDSDLSFNISDTTFSGNSLTSTADGAYGGGLYVKGDAANTSSDKNGHIELTLNNVTFSNNTVNGNTASRGGALYVGTDGSSTDVAAVTVTNGTFTGNKAEGDAAYGGALYSEGTLNIADGSTFSGNEAKFGGAVWNAGDMTMEGGSFKNNTATSAAGAIYNTTGATLNVAGVTFEGNKSAKAGAINNFDGTVTVTGSTFTGNTAGSGMGGAITNTSGNTSLDGTVSISNSTFDGNTAGNGGALWNGVDGTITVADSTFTGNSATTEDGGLGQGGAITNAGDMTFTGTNTFSGNKAAGEANDVYNSGNVTVDGGSTTMEAMVQDAGTLRAINDAQLTIGTLDARGGNVFAENASVTIDTLANDTMGSNLLVGAGSVANVGNVANADLLQSINNAGVTASDTAILAVGTPIALADGVQVVAARGVAEDGTLNGAGVAAGAYFGDGSLFIVDAGQLQGKAAITAADLPETSPLKNAIFEDGANLQVVNATKEDINILEGFDVTNGAGGSVDFSNTSVDNPDRMLNSTVSSDTAGNIIVSSTVNKASDVLPGLSHELNAPMAYVWNNALNNVDAADAGVRFLSRAARSDYVADAGKAARTIESASRMAFAGAVPQMTRMASDAATTTMINRLSLTSPIDGAKAMDANGQLVDRNGTGFALWFAPLWQYQRGWNMDAGSLNYGYEGNIGGATLGADYTFDNAIRAGVTLSVGGGHAESHGGDLAWTENDMDFWSVGAYAGWTHNNFALMADLSYTQSSNDLNQNLDPGLGMGNLSADVDGRALSMGVRAEYKLATSLVDVVPHLGVRYMWLDTRGYDVKAGNSSVLESDGFSQNIWTFPVGVTFSRDFTMDNGWYVKPNLDLSIIPAAGDIDGEDRFRFTGVPVTTSMETQIMDHLTWQGGVGLELGNNDNMNLGVNYILQAGEDVVGHGVFGTFSYKF